MICQINFPDRWLIIKTSSRDNPKILVLEEKGNLQECVLYRETSIQACLRKSLTQLHLSFLTSIWSFKRPSVLCQIVGREQFIHIELKILDAISVSQNSKSFKPKAFSAIFFC